VGELEKVKEKEAAMKVDQNLSVSLSDPFRSKHMKRFPHSRLKSYLS
jgi:hypothetical protein